MAKVCYTWGAILVHPCSSESNNTKLVINGVKELKMDKMGGWNLYIEGPY